MWYKLKRIMMRPNGVEKQVRPSYTPWPWTPWANTIAYFPLDTDLLDHSWNSFSMTTYGNVSIWTAWWVSAAYFWNIWELGWSANITGSVTALGYAYKTSEPNNDNASMFGFGNSGMDYPNPQVFYSKTRPSQISNKPWVIVTDAGRPSLTAVSMNNNEWVHFAMTLDWDTKKVKLYTNWVLSIQYTSTMNTLPNFLGMSRYDKLDRSWIGYLSNVIFEDKARTAQEVADYYNQTKANYWL